MEHFTVYMKRPVLSPSPPPVDALINDAAVLVYLKETPPPSYYYSQSKERLLIKSTRAGYFYNPSQSMTSELQTECISYVYWPFLYIVADSEASNELSHIITGKCQNTVITLQELHYTNTISDKKRDIPISFFK